MVDAARICQYCAVTFSSLFARPWPLFFALATFAVHPILATGVDFSKGTKAMALYSA